MTGKCIYCGRECSQRWQVQVHRKGGHPLQDMVTPVESVILCRKCSKRRFRHGDEYLEVLGRDG